MTDYCNSKITGKTPWGVTTYSYEPGSGEYRRPALAVATRSYTTRRPLDVSRLVDIIWRSDGQWATCPGTQLSPIPIRSGSRTLTAVCKNPRNSDKYVLYTCAGPTCGGKGKGHLTLHGWRNATHDAGCDACRAAVRDKTMRPRPAVDPKAVREAKRFDALTRLDPMPAGRGRGR